jgi:hypothetical protein
VNAITDAARFDTRREQSYVAGMRLVSLLAVLVIATACGGPSRTTYARYPGGALAFDRTSQDAKALEIADKVVVAHGGVDKWNAAKQLRWQQSIELDGKAVAVGEQAWDRWNGRHWGKLVRGEDEGNLVVMRSLYEDDAKAFMEKKEQLRKIEGGADDAIKRSKERWEFDTAILFMPWLLLEPGTKLEYAGETQSEDGKAQDALKVTFDPKDMTRLGTFFVVVDRETNMIVRVEIQKPGKSEAEKLGYALTQHQDGGGLKYPTMVQNIGYKAEIVTFKDLKVSDPDDDLWTPPPLL